MSTADDTGLEQALAFFKLGLNNIPFNHHAGFHLSEAGPEGSRLEFAMKPELIGNIVQQSLHGGVIAAAMDMVGGAAGIVAAFRQIAPEDRKNRLQRYGTIDMRVDYLRPGRGQHFTATGEVVRAGKKICVTRMALHSDNGELIATATGTYLF